MSETDLSYVSKTILNVLPSELDLTKEIKFSSYVQRREYVEVFPVTNAPASYTNSNLGTSVRIVLADPARWLDKRSSVLSLDIGGITLPAASTARFAVLDGPASCISRCNIYVGGQQINSGTINNLNKIASAIQMNTGSIASYLSDESTLTGGNTRLQSVLQNINTPTSNSVYTSVSNSPYNFIGGAKLTTGAAIDANPGTMWTTDANGTAIYPASKLATGVAGVGYYGYSDDNHTSGGQQTICIPLSVLHPFFDSFEMLPLYLCKEVVIELFFAPPNTTFVSDCCATAASGTAPVVTDNANVVIAPSTNIVSYSVTNIKVCCDLVTCSPELDDQYKLRAASSEGLIIPYDDYYVSSKTITAYTAGGNVNHQAVLSTNNLKSMLFFRQSDLVAGAQNGWSNSNYMYCGIQNYTTTVNNTNIPQNPLSSASSILAYNMRSRGAIHNQLSNCIANNPYVFGRAEVVAPAVTAQARATWSGDIPSSLTSFMIYNNYEKIHEEAIDVGNGISLSSAGSMLSVKYTEDAGAASVAKAVDYLGGANGSYSLYMVMQYGKAIIFSDGTIQVKG